MYTCPNCRQTIKEKLFAQIDEQKKKENKEQYNNAIENITLRIVKEKEYQKIVDEHNKNRKYKTSWFGEKIYDDEMWKLSTFPELYIYTERYKIVEHYPTIYCPNYYEVMYRYIECPLCNYKDYIK